MNAPVGRHRGGAGRHRAQPRQLLALALAIAAAVAAVLVAISWLFARLSKEDTVFHPDCPICKGINSHNCYRCRGSFHTGPQASREHPTVCPICRCMPCRCEADGQRIVHLAVIR